MQAMDGRHRSDKRAVGGAEKRSRTAEQAPHVRAQGGASSARPSFGEHQGEFRRQDAGETVMLGAMVLATFAETSTVRLIIEQNQVVGDGGVALL